MNDERLVALSIKKLPSPAIVKTATNALQLASASRSHPSHLSGHGRSCCCFAVVQNALTMFSTHYSLLGTQYSVLSTFRWLFNVLRQQQQQQRQSAPRHCLFLFAWPELMRSSSSNNNNCGFE